MTWVNGGHGLLTVSSLIVVGITAKNGGSGDTFWYGVKEIQALSSLVAHPLACNVKAEPPDPGRLHELVRHQQAAAAEG